MRTGSSCNLYTSYIVFVFISRWGPWRPSWRPWVWRFGQPACVWCSRLCPHFERFARFVRFVRLRLGRSRRLLLRARARPWAQTRTSRRPRHRRPVPRLARLQSPPPSRRWWAPQIAQLGLSGTVLRCGWTCVVRFLVVSMRRQLQAQASRYGDQNNKTGRRRKRACRRGDCHSRNGVISTVCSVPKDG